jgi:7-cyano-7-deazaguanine synthase
MKKKAVILLSGGLDSATCCAIAKSRGFDIYALTFDYHQRHRIEINSAKKIAKYFNAKEHRIIKIDSSILKGSSLTDNISVPKKSAKKTSQNNIPNTYVPARNTIFLSYALAYAEIINSSDIFIGVNAIDFSGYPDCRPKYISAFRRLAKLATKSALYGNPIRIHTPLINLSKAQIIKKGMTLGVDYSLTHSCYDPSPFGKPCGKCDSCILRKKGFLEAGIRDV